MRRDMGTGMGVFLFFIAILFIFGAPWVVMTAWNMILAGMFALPAISYWPAFFGTWACHIILDRSGWRSSKDS